MINTLTRASRRPQVANQADEQADRNLLHYFQLLSSPKLQLLQCFLIKAVPELFST